MAPLGSLFRSCTPTPTRTPTSSSNPPPRLLILIIALLSLLFHLYLASHLSLLSHSLAETIANEQQEGDWRRLEALRMGVGVARLSSWSSAAVAGLGACGVIRAHLPFLRLFTLHSFISLLVELCLLVLIILLTLSSSSSSSNHHSISSSLCQSLTSTDLSLDLFGYSLESCEERFASLVLTALGFVATIALARAWASFKTLEFYEALAKRHRRAGGGGGGGSKPPGLSIDTRSPSSSSSSRYRDPSPSPSKRHPPTPTQQRILLLPDPLSRAREAAARLEGGKGEEVPMLSLTASSPRRESFPPIPRGGAGAEGGEQREGEERKYLVYAPVMMSPEEALLVGARELILGSPSRHHSHSHRPRSRSTVTSSSSRHLSSSSSSTDRPTPTRSQSESEDSSSLVTPVAEAGIEFPPSPVGAPLVAVGGGGGGGGGKGKGKLA